MASGAKNSTGLKQSTEDANVTGFRTGDVVGERFSCTEVSAARRNGAWGSENVGMSNLQIRWETGSPKIQGFRGNVNQPRVRRS